MTQPFTVAVDTDGNLWMQSGPVIAFHGTTEHFQIGTGGRLLAVTRPDDEFRAAAGTGASFEGGAGNNVTAESSPLGTLVPDGFFKPSAEDEWTSGELVLTYDPGDESAEISDNTDVVATLPAASATIAPYGTFTATAYGEATYNASAPWTVDLAYEGNATTWPDRRALLAGDDSTAQAGYYSRTGWQEWTSDDDADWTITLDGTGAGEISDNTDVVAERAADALRLHDPSGGWASTPYGAATYGAAADTTAGTRSAGTFTQQDYALADVNGDVETWTGTTDATLSVDLDTTTGDALLLDGTDVVAERLGGSTTTPDGAYVATAYGIATYHSGAWTYTLATTSAGTDFELQVRLDRAYPAAGYLWVELTLDGSDEVTAVAGPFRGAALPANSATLAVVPICYSDGAGLVEQIQLGPIFWRPNP